VGDLKLQEYINLRFEPGLYYTKRDLNYPDSYFQRQQQLQINCERLTVPIFISIIVIFITENGQYQTISIGGVSTTLNLSSNSKSR
jgi:hypothetical protein